MRPMLYRGSLSEMVVPYGDPGRRLVLPQHLRCRANWGWAFSRAPCGRAWIARRTARSSTPWWRTNRVSRGTIPAAVALYERDGGIAWKHGDNTRRARDLVLSFLSEAGNYEYGFDWIFHQDGTLEMRVALTGIMSVKAVADGAHDPYSHLVAKNVCGGAPPALLHLPAGPGCGWPAEPRGGDEQRDRPGRTAESVRRRVHDAGDHARDGIAGAAEVQSGDAAAAGSCRSRARRTRWASRPATRCCPAKTRCRSRCPIRWVRKRAGFLNAHVWVTPYNERGDVRGGRLSVPEQGRRRPAEWTAANRPIDNQDVVLWYTHGDHAQSAARGLAGDAGPRGRLQASPVGILRAQSGHGHPARAAKAIGLNWIYPAFSSLRDIDPE